MKKKWIEQTYDGEALGAPSTYEIEAMLAGHPNHRGHHLTKEQHERDMDLLRQWEEADKIQY